MQKVRLSGGVILVAPEAPATDENVAEEIKRAARKELMPFITQARKALDELEARLS